MHQASNFIINIRRAKFDIDDIKTNHQEIVEYLNAIFRFKSKNNLFKETSEFILENKYLFNNIKLEQIIDSTVKSLNFVDNFKEKEDFILSLLKNFDNDYKFEIINKDLIEFEIIMSNLYQNNYEILNNLNNLKKDAQLLNEIIIRLIESNKYQNHLILNNILDLNHFNFKELKKIEENNFDNNPIDFLYNPSNKFFRKERSALYQMATKKEFFNILLKEDRYFFDKNKNKYIEFIAQYKNQIENIIIKTFKQKDCDYYLKEVLNNYKRYKNSDNYQILNNTLVSMHDKNFKIDKKYLKKVFELSIKYPEQWEKLYDQWNDKVELTNLNINPKYHDLLSYIEKRNIYNEIGEITNQKSKKRKI